jgi:CheY-like chemotaxis protein
LLGRIDGELNSEQEKQVTFIRKAADTLTELINDLLDIAKIEAGKITVRPSAFEVSELFSTLRGMLRPLLLGDTVSLVFDDPQEIPTLYTDDNKVSQILRNFLSNALKFTEQGEIQVSATLSPGGDAIIFAVADTGIGIAPEDQERIFQEFTQLENPLQKRVKGTGLGLPLCRRLAELLGALPYKVLSVLAPLFLCTLPLRYKTPSVMSIESEVQWESDPTRIPVLIVEDEMETQFIYEKFLKGTQFQAIPALSLFEAQQAMLRVKPQVIILDILMAGKDAWTFLSNIKSNTATKDIPILIVSTVEDQRKGLALGANAYCIKPIEHTQFLTELMRLTGQPPPLLILIIDDEEISRYVLRQFLVGSPYSITEATTGLEGLRRAREDQPQLIFLDLSMPEGDGYQLLLQLKADPLTKDIPIIVSTAKVLSEEERMQLTAQTVTILPKAALSHETVANALKMVFNKILDTSWKKYP